VVNLIEAVTATELRWDANRIEQVAHGDFWDDNVQFMGSRFQAILDFGFMAQRLRIDDLALPFWFYLLEPAQSVPGDAERRLLTTLLDSYDRAATRPLSMAERMSIPLIIARQPAWSVGTWIVELDEDRARRHALDVTNELDVARTVFRDIDLWQDAVR
jgi:homoserine kinase type II